MNNAKALVAVALVLALGVGTYLFGTETLVSAMTNLALIIVAVGIVAASLVLGYFKGWKWGASFVAVIVIIAAAFVGWQWWNDLAAEKAALAAALPPVARTGASVLATFDDCIRDQGCVQTHVSSGRIDIFSETMVNIVLESTTSGDHARKITYIWIRTEPVGTWKEEVFTFGEWRVVRKGTWSLTLESLVGSSPTTHFQGKSWGSEGGDSVFVLKVTG